DEHKTWLCEVASSTRSDSTAAAGYVRRAARQSGGQQGLDQGYRRDRSPDHILALASHIALAMGYAPTNNIDALLFVRRRRALARDGSLNDPLDIAQGFLLKH